MKKLFYTLSLAALVLSCTQPAKDAAFLNGKAVKGLDVVVTTAPDGNLTLRSVCFVNSGTQPVQVDVLETSPVTVEGTEVWSFQPSSTTWRKDWVLPVEKGFFQRIIS